MTPTRRHCRACQSPIFWALTKNGKRIPIDAEPTANGNVLLAARGDNVICHILTQADPAPPASRNRYKSHFATCTASDHFRK